MVLAEKLCCRFLATSPWTRILLLLTSFFSVDLESHVATWTFRTAAPAISLLHFLFPVSAHDSRLELLASSSSLIMAAFVRLLVCVNQDCPMSTAKDLPACFSHSFEGRAHFTPLA